MQKKHVRKLALFIVLALLVTSAPFISHGETVKSALSGESFITSVMNRFLSKSWSDGNTTFRLCTEKRANNTYRVTLYAINAEGLKTVDGSVYYDDEVFEIKGSVMSGPFIDAYDCIGEITSAAYNTGKKGEVIISVAIANQILSDSEYAKKCEEYWVEAANITTECLEICSFKLSVIDDTAKSTTITYRDKDGYTYGICINLKCDQSEEPTDPVTPTDPAEPTDPATPTDPAEPTDPVTPTDPAAPTEPSTLEDYSDGYYGIRVTKNADRCTVSLIAKDAEGLEVVDGTLTYDANVLKLARDVSNGEFISAYDKIGESVISAYNTKNAGEVILGIAIANHIYSDEEYAKLVEKYGAEDAAKLTTKNMVLCSLGFTVIDDNADSTVVTYTDKNGETASYKINLKDDQIEEPTTDPATPTDPAEPTDPATPTDPAEPTDPVVPEVHEYSDFVTVTEPTCTTDGVKKKTCKNCDDVVTETIPALGHDWSDEWTIDTQPTCTQPGVQSHHCKRCGARDEMAVSLTHTFDDCVETIKPTCTEEGYSVYKCTHCSETEKRDYVAALGHDLVNHVAKAPTCTEIGWDAYDTCSRCDYTTYVEKAALGHTVVTDAAVAATCTKTGLTAGSHCSVCNTVIKKQETVKALGHTVVTDAAVAATCTKSGLTDGSHCSVCNTVIKKQETVKALGHTVVTDAAVAATCTKTGLTAGSHCSVCNTVIKKQETVKALGHTVVTDAAVAATCTKSGLTAGSHCSVCNTVIKKQETVKALGHTVVTDAAVAATCTKTGLTAGSHCSVCNTVIKKQETVKALGHTVVTDAAVAATCTKTGLTAGSHCSVCNTVIKKQETVKALGHTVVTDAAVAATCTKTGLTAGSHCSVCNTVIKKQETVKALGHTVVTDAAVAATCTKSGLTAGSHCSVCNTVIKKQETVKALGHTVVIDAAVAAICTKSGLTAGLHCSVCNTVIKKQETVKALGHTVVTDAAVAATCTKSGLTAGSHCSVCNTVITAQKTVDALGHDFTGTVRENADGTVSHKCTRCDAYGPGEKTAVDIAVEAVVGKKEVLENGEKVAVSSIGMSVEVLIKTNENAKIVDKDGKEVDENAPLATGMKLYIGFEFVEIAVLGDVDCDGAIGVSDARLALRAAVQLDTLTGVVEVAAKVGAESIGVSQAREILRAAVKLDDGKSWIK